VRYRPEIDGLRAVAVIPVILFHAGFEHFSGGYVGVDVFFVISGYLITTILIEDIENDRFSIVNFYERRARRILPPLFFVMIACIPFAWILMLPSQMKDFSESLVAVSVFVSNILFWLESGYFEAAAEEKPLLHTWSLAVEEQYYVVFPIFLFVAWRFGKNSVFWIIVALTLISLALSEWGWRNMPSANFYLAPTRAWELLAGSIASFIVQKRGVQSNNLLSLIGAFAIIFAILVYDQSTPFPSLYALVPVVGVVVLVLFSDSNTYVGKLLSSKLFVGIGLISYSAYLWHQPLFAFARLGSVGHPSPTVFFLLSILSLVLAFLSWKYVEAPFRKKQRVKRSRIFAFSIILGSTFATIGLFGHSYPTLLEQKWLERQKDTVVDTYNIYKQSEPDFWINPENGIAHSLTPCRFRTHEITDDVENRLVMCRNKFGKGTLIIGDSHARDLFGVVTSRFENPFIIGITRDGFHPYSDYDYCHYNGVRSFISNNGEIFEKVIYEQAGFYLLRKADGEKVSREMFRKISPSERIEGIVPDIENIEGTLTYLRDLSELVPVVWFLPRAEPHLRQRHVIRSGCDANFNYRPNQYEIYENLDKVIASKVNEAGFFNLISVSQNEVFDFDLSDDFMDCNNLYWSDGDHFSAAGEKRFGSRLPETFLEHREPLERLSDL